MAASAETRESTSGEMRRSYSTRSADRIRRSAFIVRSSTSPGPTPTRYTEDAGAVASSAASASTRVRRRRCSAAASAAVRNQKDTSPPCAPPPRSHMCATARCCQSTTGVSGRRPGRSPRETAARVNMTEAERSSAARAGTGTSR
eukprot:scaffold15321_cov116-Isochrysis_galbana.AAC.5